MILSYRPNCRSICGPQNFDTKHTTDFNEGHLLTDSEIRRIAIDEERIVVTKDQDFLDLYLLKGFPPRVLLLRLGNITNLKLINMFISNQSRLFTLLEEGEWILFSEERILAYKKYWY